MIVKAVIVLTKRITKQQIAGTATSQKLKFSSSWFESKKFLLETEFTAFVFW